MIKNTDWKEFEMTCYGKLYYEQKDASAGTYYVVILEAIINDNSNNRQQIEDMKNWNINYRYRITDIHNNQYIIGTNEYRVNIFTSIISDGYFVKFEYISPTGLIYL
jgi:hypothetical protein